ncbi:MAG: sigma-70 family RNA polymerase sigma factor [Phycisphaerales bacterium]|nr:sigma-70 family RNA polymerase sigma factor [Phycisphaerales bacterium]
MSDTESGLPLHPAAGGTEAWPAGTAQILPSVYRELRELAAARIQSLSPGASLQPTELVHEVFMRLNRADDAAWESKRHFVAAAALAMRSVLIDRARSRSSLKRGGQSERVRLDDLHVAEIQVPERLVEIDHAISELEREDSRSARVVILRFYLGLGDSAVAQTLGVAERTVRRDWAFARAWLQRHLAGPAPGAGLPRDERP